MSEIRLLENGIQYYPWGSRTAISELLRKPPSGRPEAELWIGAHPKCPSSVVLEGGVMPLPDWIARNPDDVLGRTVAAQFGGTLPLLLKVLAARRPLSIQVHPNKTQAEEGFQREEQSGIPLRDQRRNYKDDNPKPEIICALTDFWALKGFRPLEEILVAFQNISVIEPEWAAFRDNQSNDGLREFFQSLMGLDLPRTQILIGNLVQKAFAHLNRPTFTSAAQPKDQHWYWIAKLDELYPDDLGVACVLMLNLVHLKPLEALYLPAGELHAYLEGTGIELMANSDNVLRGGLTQKHVDIPELLRIVEFQPQSKDLVRVVRTSPASKTYRTPAQQFELSVTELHGSQSYTTQDRDRVEILLVTEGNAKITAERPTVAAPLPLPQGSSVLIPAALTQYRIDSLADKTTLFRAAVP